MTWTYIITLASIVGTVANVRKKRWCFVVWLFTNAAWCVVDTYKGLYSQAMLFAVYVALAAWGLVQWRRSQKNENK